MYFSGVLYSFRELGVYFDCWVHQCSYKEVEFSQPEVDGSPWKNCKWQRTNRNEETSDCDKPSSAWVSESLREQSSFQHCFYGHRRHAVWQYKTGCKWVYKLANNKCTGYINNVNLST